jgi:hypothetical protein
MRIPQILIDLNRFHQWCCSHDCLVPSATPDATNNSENSRLLTQNHESVWPSVAHVAIVIQVSVSVPALAHAYPAIVAGSAQSVGADIVLLVVSRRQPPLCLCRRLASQGLRETVDD